MGLEPTTLYTLDRALYQLSYRGSSAGWAQISHLIVHLMNTRQSALPTELPRQLSWLGPNLTSHSTPDEQAVHVYMYMYVYTTYCITTCTCTCTCMFIHMHTSVSIHVHVHVPCITIITCMFMQSVLRASDVASDFAELCPVGVVARLLPGLLLLLCQPQPLCGGRQEGEEM